MRMRRRLDVLRRGLLLLIAVGKLAIAATSSWAIVVVDGREMSGTHLSPSVVNHFSADGLYCCFDQ
ncbi:MAG: hypothetical protein RLZZ511_2787 [Cyanobacteriota bacterium]|jgi:hypothetical protein